MREVFSKFARMVPVRGFLLKPGPLRLCCEVTILVSFLDLGGSASRARRALYGLGHYTLPQLSLKVFYLGAIASTLAFCRN